MRYISHRKLSDIASNPGNHGYTAIELSPEILEACGFVKGTGDYMKDSVVYSNGVRLYQHEENEYSVYGYNEQRVYVSYLHQLQNLFYLLSGGTELPIDEKIFRKAEEKYS